MARQPPQEREYEVLASIENGTYTISVGVPLNSGNKIILEFEKDSFFGWLQDLKAHAIQCLNRIDNRIHEDKDINYGMLEE